VDVTANDVRRRTGRRTRGGRRGRTAAGGLTTSRGLGPGLGTAGEQVGRETPKFLPPLPAGTYRVKWHVVSVDTHRTQGDFKFTVKR